MNVEEAEAENIIPDNSDNFGEGFIPNDNPGNGGGFVLNNVSESDGGFLIEPQTTENQTKVDEKRKRSAKPLFPALLTELQVQVSVAIPPTTNRGTLTHSKPIGPTIESTFGNLTEEELTEARLFEEFYADKKSSNIENDKHKQDLAKNLAQRDREVEKIRAEAELEDEEKMKEKEKEEDKSSLLSENPSDAEAEPEWLP
ncbi:MAG: hypothetical protein Q9180_008991 [Flavoplaca navasiana]